MPPFVFLNIVTFSFMKAYAKPLGFITKGTSESDVPSYYFCSNEYTCVPPESLPNRYLFEADSYIT